MDNDDDESRSVTLLTAMASCVRTSYHEQLYVRVLARVSSGRYGILNVDLACRPNVCSDF